MKMTGGDYDVINRTLIVWCNNHVCHVNVITLEPEPEPQSLYLEPNCTWSVHDVTNLVCVCVCGFTQTEGFSET